MACDGVRLVDGRVTQPTPRGFLDGVGADGWPAGVRLLLVDTAEALGGLETWLREEFLPQAPARALVVIASRREPEPGWAADPAWSEALRTVSLRNLPPDEAAAFLRRRQVPDPEVPGVLGFTGLSRVVLNVSNAVVLAVPLVALVATSQTVSRSSTQDGLTRTSDHILNTFITSSPR